MRRLARRRWLGGAVGVAALLLIVLADRGGWLLEYGGDMSRYHNRLVTVTRVVDGDTLDVNVPDGPESFTRVRLWGIDTPERARPPQYPNAEPFAEEAADHTRQLCEGKTVRLILESHRLRGRYGRLLAYVELPDGTMLNERLIAEGLAIADPRFEHRLLERFRLVEKQAKFEKRGIWSAPRSSVAPKCAPMLAIVTCFQ